MSIPDYQSLMLPLLELAADGLEHKRREAIDSLADRFSLTKEELADLLPSGTQTTFENRVAWARSYLKQAGLLESPKRGAFRITDRGRQVLAEKPPQIDVAFLNRFPEFQAFRTRRRGGAEETDRETPEPDTRTTPEDQLAAAYRQLRRSMEVELLDLVKAGSPRFFEQLVVDLLVKMGYGGSYEDAGKAVGQSGDGGIDGIINEDKLGLDVIYLQAKRWEGSVGRPEIQKFAGALQGQRAKKGVFITTSEFTRDAAEYASRIDSKIILIDGERLGALMFDHDVGVSTVGNYKLKKIDADYFEGE